MIKVFRYFVTFIIVTTSITIYNVSANNIESYVENQYVNRLDMCKSCINIYKKCTGENFTVWDADSVIVDVDDDDVRMAWFMGLMKGTDTYDLGDYGIKCYFSPQEIVNREQAATVFYRLIRLLDKEISKTEPYESTGFYDDWNISTWAKDSIESLRIMGKIIGDENNCFNPKKGITKEELDIVLSRITEQYMGTQNYSTKLYSWY